MWRTLLILPFVACAADAPTPRQMFDHQVAPLIQARCSATAGGCHTTVLSDVTSPQAPLLDYATIVGDPKLNGGFVPANAELVTPPIPLIHANYPWNADELQSIDRWLLAEAAAH